MLSIFYASLPPFTGSVIWTYCHLSICHRLWFAGKERAPGVSLRENAEVLLGPSAQRCQRKIGPATRYPPHHSDSLDPRRVMEITCEVARLGESLSRRHQDTEKSSRPERRRPRRHQQLSAMTLRQSRVTKYVKMRCQFLRLLDSKAG